LYLGKAGAKTVPAIILNQQAYMTDQELIDGLSRKNRAAIHFLVNKYQRQVIKTAHYFLQDMEEAEDLSQEIFIIILDSVNRFRKSASLSTWIYRITVNRSLNQLKKLNRKNFIRNIGNIFMNNPGNTGEKMDLSGETVHEVERKENQQLLANAIGRLPDNQRIAFVLSKYDELTYQEIADIMNLSLSSVESLIHRAKMNLQKKLVQYFPEFKKH
jgi:RNA polymerase sigma factor (sigma-70 family)